MSAADYDFDTWCATAHADTPDTVGQLAQLIIELANDTRSDGMSDAIQHRLYVLMPRTRAVIDGGLSRAHRVLGEIIAIRTLADTAEAMSTVAGASLTRWVASMQASYVHQTDVLRNEALVLATNAAFHELVTLARGVTELPVQGGHA